MTKSEGQTYSTPISQYIQGDFDGKNKSGWDAVGDQVIVLPDQAAKKVGSIIVPESVSERNALAAESGTLIAIGPDAFTWNHDRTVRLESGDRPKVGSRVVMNRYAGIYMHGDDGQKYMIMADHSIKAFRTA